MTSSISSNNVKTDDAVTVKVKISGNGNIKLIKNPEVAFPNDFDVYDPKVEVDIKTTTAGSSGTGGWAQTMSESYLCYTLLPLWL